MFVAASLQPIGTCFAILFLLIACCLDAKVRQIKNANTNNRRLPSRLARLVYPLSYTLQSRSRESVSFADALAQTGKMPNRCVQLVWWRCHTLQGATRVVQRPLWPADRPPLRGAQGL